MKLLNCITLLIEEFGPSAPPPYAILSHRWEDGEVTYQDVIDPQGLDQKAGWAKISGACRVALFKGYEYMWVDTCCINKQDFTEVHEAINSMFKWYANAAVCFAYLSDVGPGHSPLKKSLWFTRGWTLQELIAPRNVEFFNRNWKSIGTRAELCDKIYRPTRIDKEVLLHEPSSDTTIEVLLDRIPVARRLSWASRRTTTREEDIAYSLLGIFGIQMPLLYGEGKNAFLRLQMEIMKETKDMTLFAWTWHPANPGQQSPPEYRGILATCPKEFEGASKMVFTRDIKENPEYSMTNKGLRISTEIIIGRDKTHHYLRLGCCRGSGKSLGISLKSQGGGVFLRSRPDQLFPIKDDAATKALTLYIKKHMSTAPRPWPIIDRGQSSREHTKPKAPVVAARGKGFRSAYRFHRCSERIEFVRAVPESRWVQKRHMFSTRGLKSFEGFVEFKNSSDDTFIVACGFTSPDTKWAHVASRNSIHKGMYNAAMRGDLKLMQELGQKARRATRANDLETRAAYEKLGFIELEKTEDGRILDVYVYDNTDDGGCLVM